MLGHTWKSGNFISISQAKKHKETKLLESSNSLIKNHRKMIEDQATKSVEWMPWHQEPMKDAISCEKLREAANKL